MTYEEWRQQDMARVKRDWKKIPLRGHRAAMLHPDAIYLLYRIHGAQKKAQRIRWGIMNIPKE